MLLHYPVGTSIPIDFVHPPWSATENGALYNNGDGHGDDGNCLDKICVNGCL